MHLVAVDATFVVPRRASEELTAAGAPTVQDVVSRRIDRWATGRMHMC